MLKNIMIGDAVSLKQVENEYSVIQNDEDGSTSS